MGKYENVPHSDSGIRKPVSGKSNECSSIVGWIMGCLRTLYIPVGMHVRRDVAFVISAVYSSTYSGTKCR
jgi:hypothetical protein